MKDEKDKKDTQQNEKSPKDIRKEPHSSAFNEPGHRDQKSTHNIEEANLEQDRKDAMTERD